MADNKKNFIVYTSWSIWLNVMTKEQKGEWLDWVMSYCNDENPELPKDPVVKMGCSIAKENLKRDLAKYDAKVESIKQAREKKLHNNLNTNQDEIKMKSNSNQDEIKSVNVNDNVNVNVNVNDKDINILKESIKEKDEPDVSSCTSTSEEKISKHKFGSFQTILLTDDEFSKLCSEFGKSYILEVIERLDEYKKMNGNKNKWKVDNLVIRKAIRENWSLIRNIDVESLKKRDMELETSLDDESLQVLEGLEI